MKYYLKGCLSAKKCQSFELDSKGDLWNCNVICCKGDLCNGDHPQYHWPAQWWSSSMNAIFLPLYASRSRLLWDLITVIKSLNFADNNIPFFLRESKSEILLLGKVLTQRLFSFLMKRSCMDLQLGKPGGCLRFWLHVIVLMQLCKLLRLINVFLLYSMKSGVVLFQAKNNPE